MASKNKMSRAWKNLENKAARLLCGTRIIRPDWSIEAPDVVTPLFAVECKYRKRYGFEAKWWEQAVKNAKKINKAPLLVFKNAGKHDEYVVMKLSDLSKLLERGNLL